jgi:hypothetical protein
MIGHKLCEVLKHGGLGRALEILNERRTTGASFRSFTYSWPKNVALVKKSERKACQHFFVPHLDASRAYGGIVTIVEIALKSARNKNHIHFVLCDAKGSLEAIPLMAGLKNHEWLELRHQFTLSDFSKKSAIKIDISSSDTFVATAWWTKLALDRAKPTLENARIFYLIQDDESLFYDCHDVIEQELSQLAKESYKGSFHAIINSQFLADYFISQNILNPKKLASWTVIPPHIQEKYFYSDPQLKKEKIIFVYARPDVRRNRFDLCVNALKKVAPRIPADWRILAGGSLKSDIFLAPGLRIEAIGKLPFEDYAKLCRITSVALCLMECPHPSYPPLELGSSGAYVVCNKFGGRDYSVLGKQYLCCKLEANDIATKLGSAISMVDAR